MEKTTIKRSYEPRIKATEYSMLHWLGYAKKQADGDFYINPAMPISTYISEFGGKWLK